MCQCLVVNLGRTLEDLLLLQQAILTPTRILLRKNAARLPFQQTNAARSGVCSLPL